MQLSLSRCTAAGPTAPVVVYVQGSMI